MTVDKAITVSMNWNVPRLPTAWQEVVSHQNQVFSAYPSLPFTNVLDPVDPPGPSLQHTPETIEL
jgi:hypothetical protein